MRSAALKASLALAASLLAPAAGAAATEAGAAPLAPFQKFCEKGAAAGRCNLPRGVAVSPVSGHVFVANQLNDRIDEFTAWGEFVKAWGWGVRTGAAELQVCTASPPGCREGLKGSGVGQLKTALGVAVDSEGDVYAIDRPNFRVEKFSPDGEFLLMFGGGVDQGPNHPGNLCTAAYLAEGDTCGAGTAGTADGQFASSWSVSSDIAVGPGDEVFVGDEERIQVFDAGGAYQRQLPIPQPGVVGELAVDPSSGDLYMGYLNGLAEFEKTLPDVYRLDPATGAVEDTLEVDKPAALATDATGEVFVFDQQLVVNGEPENPGTHRARILRFDASGEFTEIVGGAGEIRNSVGLGAGTACFGEGEAGLYAAVEHWVESTAEYIQAYGPHPDPLTCPPPQVPPSIDAQFAASVSSRSATVAARINPHYFTPPVGVTTYRMQWASAACVEAGGWEAPCVGEEPERELQGEPVNEGLATDGILLSGLAPGAEYRYRFIAEGSGEPGEAIGTGGKPGEPGAAASFTTYPTPTPLAACANDSLRPGAAANLPDCRAYELVSPLDKAGGDIQARPNLVPFEARMDQAALSGDALTYSSYRAFGDARSAPFSSQYLARRTASGWRSEAISPPQEGEAFLSALMPVDNLFRAFSADLDSGWLQTDTEPVLGAGGVAGHPNIYRRQSAGGAYEGCTTALPQLEEQAHGPQLQGFSADGGLGVFRIENELTPEADEESNYQLYACAYPPGGGAATLRLISALPNGAASKAENTVGGPANQIFQSDQGRTESLQNAVSDDGGKVFWTASTGLDAKAPGALYVRLNPAEPPTASGSCTGGAEATRACTLRIDAGPARFWLAAGDGSRAIYTDSSGKLEEYSVASRSSTQIAGEALGVLGASEDASVVYYLAEEADAEAQEEGAVEGQPNLYRYEAGGETAFIGTLSAQDAYQGDQNPAPANPEPAFHTARVSPDGQTLAFTSNSALLAEEVAGYDNTDQAGGSPAMEVYRYSTGGGLACVSCNRTGSRPRGREVQNKHIANSPVLYAASMLPPWLNSLYAPRDLSEDGSRVLFESFEPLALADTNGRADVYEWEAFGAGSCTDKSASAYVAKSNGCVYLISSGESSTDSQFVDASPDGHDVFIRTASSLVPWDPGQIDIYDAREGGGFPAPPAEAAPCEGEACQPPAGAPTAQSPASASFRGPGDLGAARKRKGRRCPRGRHPVRVRPRHGHRRKTRIRCVKRHRARHRRHRRHRHRHRRGRTRGVRTR